MKNNYIPKYRKLWICYFLFLVLGSFYAIVNTIYQAERNIDTEEYLGYILTVISSVGLYGFVFQKRILDKSIFVMTLVFVLIQWAWAIPEFIAVINSIEGQWDGAVFLGLGLSMFLITLLTLPLYVALYLYAFKSEHIWGGDHKIV